MSGTLAGTLPQLQAAYTRLEQLAAQAGISVTVNDYGGFRDAADTARILFYRQADYDAALQAGDIPPYETIDQFRPVAEYGESFHDYGAAVDVSPMAWPASESYDWAVAQLGAFAPRAGLRQPLPTTDPAHFELPVSLADAQAMYAAAGGSGAPLQTAGVPLWLALALGGALLWIVFRPARRLPREAK